MPSSEGADPNNVWRSALLGGCRPEQPSQTIDGNKPSTLRSAEQAQHSSECRAVAVNPAFQDAALRGREPERACLLFGGSKWSRRLQPFFGTGGTGAQTHFFGSESADIQDRYQPGRALGAEAHGSIEQNPGGNTGRTATDLSVEQSLEAEETAASAEKPTWQHVCGTDGQHRDQQREGNGPW